MLDQERLQERLRVELKNDLPDVKILSLPKSGGVCLSLVELKIL